MEQNLLTLSEMAEVLKVPKSWLYTRTRETGPGTIPRLRVGKYIRFVEEDVMCWLEKQQRAKQRYKQMRIHGRTDEKGKHERR